MKRQKYYSLTFVSILFFFAIGIISNLYIKSIELFNKNKYNKSTSASNYVNWKEEYPIEKNESELPLTTNNKLCVQLYNKIKKLIQRIDNRIRLSVPGRLKYVEIWNLVNRITDKKTFNKFSNMIILNNGYLTGTIPEKSSYADEGERTVRFAKYIEERNIDFAYILCPSKISKYKKDLPYTAKDYSNENADTLLDTLKKNKIKILDLREEMNRDFSDYQNAFFKTDHHWKPETGLWASEKIIKFINKEMNQKLDETLLQKNNFCFNTFPNFFLGSQGRQISLALAKPEDFSLITPKFQTNFHYEAYCRDITRKGEFKESLLDTNKLSEKDFYKQDTYMTYLGCDCPVVRIINNLTTSNLKILIINDSFICVTAPFLACLIKEIVLVDFRPNRGKYFNGSIKKLIEKEKPNIVFIHYSVEEFDPKFETRSYLHTFY